MLPANRRLMVREDFFKILSRSRCVRKSVSSCGSGLMLKHESLVLRLVKFQREHAVVQ